MMVLQGNSSMGHLARTACILGEVTTTLSSVLLIGCYCDQVPSPSEPQGLGLFFLAQSE